MTGSIADVLAGAADLAIFEGPQDKLFSQLPDDSVEAVITDPPYGREYLGTYTECYEESCRVLKPHGDLLMILPHYALDPFDELDFTIPNTLRYRWTLAMLQRTGPQARLCNAHRNLRVTYKPIGWWYKPGPQPSNYREVVDTYDNPPPTKIHKWQQSREWAAYCIDCLYYPTGVIVDPMVGSGTTALVALEHGYRAIVGDADPEAIALVKEAVCGGVRS